LTCDFITTKSLNNINLSTLRYCVNIRSDIQTQIDQITQNLSNLLFNTISSQNIYSNKTYCNYLNSSYINNTVNISCNAMTCEQGQFTILSSLSTCSCNDIIINNNAFINNTLNCYNGCFNNISSDIVKVDTINVNHLNVEDVISTAGNVYVKNLTPIYCSCTSMSALNFYSKSSLIENLVISDRLSVNEINCAMMNGLTNDQFYLLSNLTSNVQDTLDGLTNLIVQIRPSLDDISCYNATFKNLEAAFCIIDASLVADTLETDYMQVNCSLQTEDIDVKGQAMFVSPIINGYSDERLKIITSYLDGKECLDKIKRLECFKYIPNIDTFEQNGIPIPKMIKEEIGLSAQDVQSMFPETVCNMTNSSFLSIQYERLIPILIAAIQELDRRS
jgi:hypothetical protein